MRYTRWLASSLAVLVLPWATLAQEQKSALAQVPAGSPIVVQIRGVERTKNRLLTLVKNAVPDLAPTVQGQVDAGLKQMLTGRELTGLAADGPVFIVFTEMPKPGETPPALAVVLRTTDAAAFRKGILTDDERKTLKRDPAGFEEAQVTNEPTYFVTRDNYVVITPKKEVATQFTKSQPGLDTKLNKEVARRLLEADVALYVDTTAVNKEYGDQIKGGRQLLELVLQQGQTGIQKGQMELVKNFVTGVFQAFDDSRTFVLSVDFRPEGLALHGGIQIAPNTPSNGFLKPLKPMDLSEVSSLPAGQMAYSVARFDPSLGKVLQQLMMGLMVDPESEQGKTIQKALDQLAQAGPRCLLQAQNLRSEGIQVGQYSDPAKAVQAVQALFQALREGGSFSNIALKTADVKAGTQKHRDFVLHQAQLVWDFEKMAEAQPGGKDLAEAMKKILGESLTIWFGTNGKIYVQVSARDWAGAQKYLDAYLDGQATVGKEQAFQEARKQLPAQATMLALYDVPQMAQLTSDMLYTIFKSTGLGNVGEPPAVAKGKLSFGGGVVTLQSENASFDLWIPASAAGEFRKRFEPLIRSMQGK